MPNTYKTIIARLTTGSLWIFAIALYCAFSCLYIVAPVPRCLGAVACLYVAAFALYCAIAREVGR